MALRDGCGGPRLDFKKLQHKRKAGKIRTPVSKLQIQPGREQGKYYLFYVDLTTSRSKTTIPG